MVVRTTHSKYSYTYKSCSVDMIYDTADTNESPKHLSSNQECHKGVSLYMYTHVDMQSIQVMYHHHQLSICQTDHHVHL